MEDFTSGHIPLLQYPSSSPRSSPIQIGLCTYLMYNELGTAVFSGLAVLVLAVPLNALAAGVSRRFQMRQMAAKDRRVRLMNEILGGVKVLKLHGWEESFAQQVKCFLT